MTMDEQAAADRAEMAAAGIDPAVAARHAARKTAPTWTCKRCGRTGSPSGMYRMLDPGLVRDGGAGPYCTNEDACRRRRAKAKS